MEQFLSIFPVLTFLLATIIGILNLWLANKLNKLREEMTVKLFEMEKSATRTKEEILKLLREEFTARVRELQGGIATKDQMRFLKKEMVFMFKNIAMQLKLSTSDFENIDTE